MSPAGISVQDGVTHDVDLTIGRSPAAPREAMSAPGLRVFLSAPEVGDIEVEYVVRALRSGWVAPVGPDLDAFEREICDFTGVGHAVALASGTAAIQLGLMALGVGPGDEVVVPTLTFAATAFAVVHAGARPVFLDSDESTWNLDAELLEAFLAQRARAGRLPAALITVDLFGRLADHDRILAAADRYGIPVLEDAAEALGSTVGSRAAGSFGRVGVFSFNGNKIMTTSGGGMLVTAEGELARRVRHWATQARENVPWYEHTEIGFNHRMSNVLAALGRAQLKRLPQLIDGRRSINRFYREQLSGCDAVDVIGDVPPGRSNMWLTTIRVDPGAVSPQLLRERLAELGIESRPVWKPMHQQPVFQSAEANLSGAADRIFATGLCLPSWPGVGEAALHQVVATVRGEVS